ncbi:glycosyltransferase family 4 protein [Pedobacter montanisoli]|uniref:glycosyltransferase family 4 protein n=1 Tax=Pedobacter montanisoli TaxID=2923277 RepID=UPI00293F782F|nr:glycosyltransferase family 1 protein [Pedobacter montanisoli]
MEQQNDLHTALQESSKLPKGFGLSALKIGYDGKRAANNLTGLGNYSRSLIEQLAVIYPSHNFYIYTTKIKENLLQLPLFKLDNVHLKLAKVKGLAQVIWRSFSVKKQLIKDQINLFHGLSHEIPFGIQHTQVKSVVTIHDLIFLRMPQLYKLIDRKIYTFKSRYACVNADRIIAISECTKKDIIELYNISPSKIDVVYQSCDDIFKKPLTEEAKKSAREKYQLPEHYILSIGTIEARKNLGLIIDALPHINENYKLVVIGKETSYAALIKEKIKSKNLENRVIFLKNVPFSDFPAIYQNASLFIYPSRYEGFGIPIIEALYSKVPVIAATGSCLEEAGGPDSLYIQPDDPDTLAKTSNHVLSDPALAQQMQHKGYEYVQKFNNNLVAHNLMNCYLKTLSN